MLMRPADIARRLKVSTSTLRKYEDLGMIPKVLRSPNGYRIYTEVHLAYFICIREMLHGFHISEIAGILKLVMSDRIDEAFWKVNKALTVIQQDKCTCEQIKQRFLQKQNGDQSKEFSIDDVSKATGIASSTLRYWDKIGLISANRCMENNYRMFTQRHIDEILMIHALKLSMAAREEKYTIEQMRKEIYKFEFDDYNRISSIVAGIEHYLTALNRARMRSISALYHLCKQVEQNQFDE